ncbi:pectin acetylesterase 11-like isoform X2 [Salvia splendens]|uniref:pectin acetylesterase 11-like isoform X2 n=1 Tax=Salvia splendens TaxID=180675 RepID=UPI001C27E480|nr:pectin acetylesterase 11-like isoform X2 [Salvia splendens]
MEIARYLLLFLMWALALTTQVYGVRDRNITLLESAVAKGAVCLDGTPPAYIYSKGYGEGANNWIVYIQGGGWCISLEDCHNRSMSSLGSSTRMMAVYPLYPPKMDGMLDDNATYNPLFYNWNIFYVLYCDGSSFMSNIDQVILTGTSAGGLTTILHCDNFRTHFSQSTTVKCISDSGFFIHGEGSIGADWREERYFNVVSTHGLANLLPTSCTTRMNPALCLFPEYLINDVQTPLFLVESAFDLWQIQNLIPPDTLAGWDICDHDTTTIVSQCNWTQYSLMKDFRATFIQTLKSLDNSSSIGYFVHSCYAHGHVLDKKTWTCSSLAGHNVLANKGIGQAVGDWYFNHSSFQEIDMQNDLPRNCDVILSQLLSTSSVWMFSSIRSHKFLQHLLLLIIAYI